MGGGAAGIALDLARPDDLAAALADVGPVDHLVLAAIARDAQHRRRLRRRTGDCSS